MSNLVVEVTHFRDLAPHPQSMDYKAPVQFRANLAVYYMVVLMSTVNTVRPGVGKQAYEVLSNRSQVSQAHD